MSAERPYHYTSGLFIPSIIEQGLIRPSQTANPVFASTDPDYEIAACTCDTFPGMARERVKRESAELGRGLYRIEIMPAVVCTWPRFREYFPEHPCLNREERYLRHPAVDEDEKTWRMSPTPLPEWEWLGIEVFPYPDLPRHYSLGLPDDYPVDELPPAWVRVDGEELLTQYRASPAGFQYLVRHFAKWKRPTGRIPGLWVVT